ncbi:TrkH family potassium uptake protein [Dethiobacter alkaliphilus]|uniref:TrkH family potassium uptake protein n=1 Tax=Dethiobacter alkaliphilus TaxID=427926 RepID=UPI002226C53E|nr:TrkH family potassium uptake protein [Dethiobacter alkaliphilus]MCW3489615.1 TrkH family potassium uptake protein [Dethiobacter alkaliphilus]
MKWLKVCYLSGTLLMYLSFAMVVPLLWALWDQGNDRAAFLISILATLAIGRLLMYLGESPDELSIRESFAFVTIAWLAAALFSALPFFISGAIPGFIDAYFEAMSGLTTTGASILNEIETLPSGILFWRSMTHWLGGMGIIVLFIAVFPRLGISAGHMLQAESPGPISQRIAPRIAQTAKILWVIYIVISLAQTAMLLFYGFSFFDALTHTFGTVATGGFSTRNESIAAFGSPGVEWVFVIFMVIAGGNFALYYHMFFGRISALWKNSEVRLYLLITVLATVAVIFNVRDLYPSWGESIRNAAFQVTSILTTTGYTTVDYDAWPVFSRTVLFLLMFLGGCGGSTAGSIKQIRILVVIKYLVREIKKTVSPHAVIPLRIGNHVIPTSTVNSIVAFVGLYLAIFIASSMYLTFLGYDMITSLSAVAATQGNIGPGLGAVGPATSYSTLDNGAKILLSALMLVGRLEIYTVIAFLVPEFGLQLPVSIKKSARY